MVLTTKGIDDLCLKYFVEAGAIAVRRVKPEDLRRIAKATGAQVVATLADMEGGESFDERVLGRCAEVSEERVGDGELLYFRGCAAGAACTVVLRGANEFLLDEMDRCLQSCSSSVRYLRCSLGRCTTRSAPSAASWRTTRWSRGVGPSRPR